MRRARNNMLFSKLNLIIDPQALKFNSKARLKTINASSEEIITKPLDILNQHCFIVKAQ